MTEKKKSSGKGLAKHQQQTMTKLTQLCIEIPLQSEMESSITMVPTKVSFFEMMDLDNSSWML